MGAVLMRLALCLAAFLWLIFVTPFAWATIAVVNSGSSGVGASNVTSSTTTLNVTGGNALVVLCRQGNVAGATFTVSDTAGNAFTQASLISNGGNTNIALFYSANVTGNASDVISCNYSTTTQWAGISAVQYSGIDATTPLLTTTNGYRSTSSSSFTAPTIATARTSDVVVLGYTEFTSGNTFTAGTGFTNETSQNTSSVGIEDNILAATYSGGPSISSSVSQSWLGIAAIFNASPYSLSTTLALDGHSNAIHDTGQSTTNSVTLTTASPKDKVCVVGMSQGGNSFTAVNDNVPLTWSRRTQRSGANSHSSGVDVWCATATGALTSDTITPTWQFAAKSILVAFGVQGVTSLSSPWDSNASLPAVTGIDSGGGSYTAETVSTSNATDLLIGILGNNYPDGGGSITNPSGWSTVDGTSSSSSLFALQVASKSVTSTQSSVSLQFTGSVASNTNDTWTEIFDAFAGSSSPPSGCGSVMALLGVGC